MIVLDTHALIWFIDSPERLGEKSLSEINKQRKLDSVYVSCISVWEIYMLERRGRLRLSIDSAIWVSRCEQLSFLRFMPVDNDIARLSVQLPDPMHPDPADRIIVATANYLGAKLITKDQKLLDYPHVRTLW